MILYVVDSNLSFDLSCTHLWYTYLFSGYYNIQNVQEVFSKFLNIIMFENGLLGHVVKFIQRVINLTGPMTSRIENLCVRLWWSTSLDLIIVNWFELNFDFWLLYTIAYLFEKRTHWIVFPVIYLSIFSIL